MSETRLNEQILHWIKINSNGDTVLETFLKELIFEEVKHPGHWKWKDTYKQKIKTFSDKWSDLNEG